MAIVVVVAGGGGVVGAAVAANEPVDEIFTAVGEGAENKWAKDMAAAAMLLQCAASEEKAFQERLDRFLTDGLREEAALARQTDEYVNRCLPSQSNELTTVQSRAASQH